MNERIKELEQQAMVFRAGMKMLDIEKFAELIVQECATSASLFSIKNKRIHPDIEPRDMPVANRMVYHSTCQAVSQEIKQHFGFEE